ncbi:DMT family transporter [Cereibacter sphaeroides]|uniref:DMT family transporter n=1 Tax=Cereibacter sphaeroides TaxID=1063 RepID=UPI001F227555|nr:DMT family transporter [Cereibacter sphaeroides]MCE6957705.1 DMT family transporter [Cereibacter sphaeroides]MCE6967269.1 DMT family transporter [Cereibacter sphaeroides]MCE6971470.1 DMT family transporter [Cereibacter sphaeroides]
MIARTASLPSRHPLLWPIMAVLLVVGWSSGFVGIRFANEEASVVLLLFWRTLLSGVILLPFALAMGPRLNLRAAAFQMAFGVMSVFLYLGGFSLAIGQRVPTGLVALISDLLPLAIAALSQPVLGERLTRREWLGTAIAVTGVVIVSFDSLTIGTAPLWAYGLTVGSMLVFALASVLHKGRKALHLPVHQALCIQTLTGAALFGSCALLTGDSLSPPLTQDFAIGMAWLVLIATFATYSVYYTSLRLFPVAKVSAAIYLSPPVTMIWAWALFGEALTAMMFAGLSVTLLGVWMTSRDGRRLP